MTITFDNDNDVIVYALEKIIFYARNNQYIFLAQNIWCISSIIGLQAGVVSHVDTLKLRDDIELPKLSIQPEESKINPDRIAKIQYSDCDYIDSEVESVSTTETDIHNKVIDNGEAFLEQSNKDRKAIGQFTRQASRVVKRQDNKKKPIKTFGTQTEGIDSNDLHHSKAAGECQCCAWPQDRKGCHKTQDCFRWKMLEKGTAPFPGNKQYNQDKDLGPFKVPIRRALEPP
jgi:hypothetical protein